MGWPIDRPPEVPMHVARGWEWRRWQLVRLEEVERVLFVDAIELLDHVGVATGGPVTLAFPVDLQLELGDEELTARLERWSGRDEGLCDVYYRPEAATGYLVLFQRSESVVVAAEAAWT
jgi:hypothetical protein